MDSDGFGHLNLTSLEEIGSYFTITACDHLRAVHCPALKRILSYLKIYSNSELRSVDMRSLEEISSYAQIYANSALDFLDLSSLRSVNSDTTSSTAVTSDEEHDYRGSRRCTQEAGAASTTSTALASRQSHPCR